MSKYFIEGDTLTDIADAIRLKRDIVTEMTPEDMALQVSLIEGGGGQWEFLAERAETLTLAQTSFNSITPSTASQVIVANQNNYLTHRLDNVNTYNYQYLCVHETWTEFAYTQTPTAPHVLINGGTILSFISARPNGALLAAFNSQNTINYKCGVYVNASGQKCGMSQNPDYGIFLSAPIFNVPSVNTPSVTSGTWNVRAHNTYFDVSAFALLDVNNTLLKRSFKFYRIPMTDFPFNIAKKTYDRFLSYNI